MSDFDPTVFMNQTFEGANSTEILPVPEGEYLAIADKVELVKWSKRDGSASGLKCQIIWDIQDENVKTALDRDKVTARQDIMLDMNDAGTSLDMGKGKNVGLGRLRAATDLNDPAAPFSFPMIQGRMAKVMVKQRADDNDPTKVYSEVRAVTHP